MRRMIAPAEAVLFGNTATSRTAGAPRQPVVPGVLMPLSRVRACFTARGSLLLGFNAAWIFLVVTAPLCALALGFSRSRFARRSRALAPRLPGGRQ